MSVKGKIQVISLSPTPPYESGLSHYALYLYSNFSKVHVIIITNKNSIVSGNKNLTILKIFVPGVKAPWVCLRRAALYNPKILHIQVEYAFLGSWLNFLLLPLLLIILKLMCRSKIVITLHGVPSYYSIYHYFKQILKIPIMMRTLLSLTCSGLAYVSTYLSCIFSDVVIVHTDLMKNALASFIPQTMLSKVYVIAHGTYEPSDRTEKSKSDKNSITVLTFGYQRPSKGLETFMKAAKEVVRRKKNVKFMVIGKHIGRRFEKIKKLMNYDKELLIKIIDDFLEDKTLDDIIRMADIIVLPYEDLFNEVSGVLHRIALFKKPLICSNIPRFNSCLIHEKDALLFAMGDYFELSEYILRLIENNSLAEKLSKNLFEKFSRIKWKIVANQHEQLFLKLINNFFKMQVDSGG
ncbi:MAG: glycosyltransferase [Candidatus Methanomethylicaceae archaeon]